MNKFSDKQLALLAIFGALLIGGGVAPLTKVVLQNISLPEYNFLRFFLATISILPFFLKRKPKINKNIYKVLLFSLFLTGNVLIAPIGIHLTAATISQMLYVFVPIIVAIVSYFLAIEVFNLKKIVGLIFGFLGAMIIIILPELEKGSPFAGNLQGNLIVFVAVILTALYTVFSKGFQKVYTPIQLTSIFIFLTFVITIPFAISDVTSHPAVWMHIPLSVLGAAFYIGILGTTGFYLLYQYAIKHGSPLIASLLLYLQPAVTFIWASLLLGEQLTLGFLIGAILAFVGVSLTLQSHRKAN